MSGPEGRRPTSAVVNVQTGGDRRTSAVATAPSGGDRRSASISMSKSLPELPTTAPAGQSADTPSAVVGGVTSTEQKSELKRLLRSTFRKPIVGDIFGSRTDPLEGMMYRSRVQEELHLSLTQGNTESSALEAKKEKKTLGSSLASIEFERDSDSDAEMMETMNPRQQLATTIRNWSTQEENDLYLINEGAVHALIALTSMEDPLIKKCCASALCNLASRKRNRESLLSLGAASGVISISMQVKNWKNAKLCAQTLTFLSMHDGGEALLAKDGAILACVILLGLKGNRLLPLCIQALYNLTCSQEYYKGMERIVKAFLSLPAMPPGFVTSGSPFDTTFLLLQTIRNAARYSWIRARIIEDGVLTALSTIVASLRTNTPNIKVHVGLICENIRLLSESPGVRGDLVQKGALEVLMTSLPHSDDQARLQMIRAVYNLIPGIVSAPPPAAAPGNSSGTAATSAQLGEGGDGQPGTQSHRASLSGPAAARPAFDLAAQIVTHIAANAEHVIALEYVAASLAAFSCDGLRGHGHLLVSFVEVMPLLLHRTEPLTQMYALTACSHLLFADARAELEPSQMERLVLSFIRAGQTMPVDTDAVVAVVIALTRLSQDPVGLAVVQRHGLVEGTLELLLRIMLAEGDSSGAPSAVSNPIVQEISAIAVCRFALLVGAEQLNNQRRLKIAQILYQLLDNDDRNVLCNVLASVRALSERNLCVSELLQLPTLARIASIIGNFGAGDTELSRSSSAVLAAFSYDPAARVSLVNTPQVLEVLWASTKSEDSLTREMVSATICNMSVELSACSQMVERGVVEVLATLSGATSEIIQEMCAKCFCNLTCVKEMHDTVIQNKGLQTILMIALVRSVASKTKQLCARALLNLITEENIPALKEAGASRVFAAICNSPSVAIQGLCAQGFLLLSTSPSRRDDLVTRRPVLHALFSMVRCQSARSRVLVGLTLCNLLACPGSMKSAIMGGALPVFKLVATQEVEELRESAARTIVNLAQAPVLAMRLMQCPLVQILVLIMQNGNSHTLECAINAMSAMSQTNVYHIFMIDEGAVIGLVEAVMTGRVTTVACATEVVRTLFMLSYTASRMEYMVSRCHVMLTLHLLYKASLLNEESAIMVALIVRNASVCSAAQPYIVTEGALLLLRALMHCMPRKSVAIGRAVIITVGNMSQNVSLHEQIIEQGCLEMLKVVAMVRCVNEDGTLEADNSFPWQLANPRLVALTADLPEEPVLLTHLDLLRAASAVRELSYSAYSREALAAANVVKMFMHFVDFYPRELNEETRSAIAVSLQNIASSKSCVQQLVQQGTSDLLLAVSKTSTSSETQSACQLALGQISGVTKVTQGTVSSLLTLTLEKEESQAINEAGDDKDIIEALRKGIASREAAGPSAGGKGGNNLRGSDTGAGKKTLRQMIKDGISNGKVNMALQTMPVEITTPVVVVATATTTASDASGAAGAAGPAGSASSDHKSRAEANYADKKPFSAIDNPKILSAVGRIHTKHGHLEEEDDGAGGDSVTFKDDKPAPSIGLSGKKMSLKGLLGQSKFKEAVKLTVAYDMATPESTIKEMNSFEHNNSAFSYKTFQLVVPIESGGVVTKKDQKETGNVLPTFVPEKRLLQSRDRSAEMTKLTVNMLPLGKDLKVIEDFTAVPDSKSKGGDAAEDAALNAAALGLGNTTLSHSGGGLGDGSAKSRQTTMSSSHISRRKQSIISQKNLMEGQGLLLKSDLRLNTYSLVPPIGSSDGNAASLDAGGGVAEAKDGSPKQQPSPLERKDSRSSRSGASSPVSQQMGGAWAHHQHLQAQHRLTGPRGSPKEGSPRMGGHRKTVAGPHVTDSPKGPHVTDSPKGGGRKSLAKE